MTLVLSDAVQLFSWRELQTSSSLIGPVIEISKRVAHERKWRRAAKVTQSYLVLRLGRIYV